MKLRNKKTGFIGDIEHNLRTVEPRTGETLLTVRYKDDSGIVCYKDYETIEEFIEEWEDCKPKEFWLIVQDGDIFTEDDTITQDYADRLQAIGNYFETIEEAKKAVEKLKAWKRLKDKGFRFEGWNWKAQSIDCSLDYTAITEEQSEEADKDIDLLFGGKE